MENNEMKNTEMFNTAGDEPVSGLSEDADKHSSYEENTGSHDENVNDIEEIKASDSPKVQKLLDELTEGDDASTNNFEEEADNALPEDDLSALKVDQNKAKEPARSAEDEELELLRNIKSERGRERINSIISARKEAETLFHETKSSLDGFQGLIRKTGLGLGELSQTLEFGRLVSSNDETSLKLALEMVEKQREDICKRLGYAAPGVDLLSDLPELKEAVSRKEITLDHALKMARYERAERTQAQNLAQMREIEQGHHRRAEEIISVLGPLANSAETYFKQFENQADYPVKIQRIKDCFFNPVWLNNFVSNFSSNQWLGQFKFMYDNIVVPPQRQQNSQRPIRSRPTASGTISDKRNMSNAERIMMRLDEMGI